MVVAVPTSLLGSVVRSKADLYRFFTLNQQKFLPKYELCTMGKSSFNELTLSVEFLKEVLATTKSLMDAKEVKRISVPHFAEVSNSGLTIEKLSVKELYPKVRQHIADDRVSSSR